MKLSGKQTAIGAFLLWESYWAFVFFSAPNPDEKMDSVMALLMAVFFPMMIGGVIGLSILAWRLGRRRN
jgi:hypothetical protein